MAGKRESLQHDTQVLRINWLNKTLIAKCAKCRDEIPITITAYWRRRRRTSNPWSCYQCQKLEMAAASKNNPIYKDPNYRSQFAALHKDPIYAAKVHNAKVRAKIAESVKGSWQDENIKQRHLAHRQTKESKQRCGKLSKMRWADAKYREAQLELRRSEAYRAQASARSCALWQNETYRAKLLAILDKARPLSAPKQDKPSSLQSILYSILDDLGVVYHREGPATTIGPIVTTNNRFAGYCFDCLVEHNGIKLFIECHGEHWHQKGARHNRDQSKATFLKTYFPDYQLMVLWEYEFRSPNRIKELIRTKLGLKTIKPAEFKLSDLIIETTEATIEVRCFLATHHYLANIGRYGSHRVVLRHGKRIVGAAVYSHPTRKESYERLKVRKNEILELTRFCLHPSYQRKNLASWFMSKSIHLVRRLVPKLKVLLTFADTSFGHSGTIYKAANWTADGIVRPDYWYSDGNSWYHKKSVWDLASKHGQTENVFAAGRGLRKVAGKEKLRFVYRFK